MIRTASVGLVALEEISNRICYTGQQYDQQTDQYYLRARYYNPILGRFMQEDVYQGNGLNLYAYCHNNPIMYYDPSGYQEEINACVTEQIGEGKPTIEELAQQVPDEYKKLFKCDEFANHLEMLMKENGLKGTRIDVRSKTGYIL